MSQGAGSGHTTGENPGNGTSKRTGPWPAATAALVFAGILAADLYAPPGAAVGIVYGLPIYLVSRVAPSLILPATAIATMLAAGAYLYEPQLSARSPVLTNLTLVLCGLWAWAWTLKNGRQALRALHSENARPRGEDSGQWQSHDPTPAPHAGSAGTAEMRRQAAIVAHDLRNPISVIATSIEFISAKAELSNPELEAAIERAKRAIGRCEKMIAEHLELARSGQRLRPVAIDRWLSKVLDELTLPEAVTLRRELNANGAHIALDKEAMRRALINLVDNACQAMLGDEHGLGSAVPTIVVSSRSDGAAVEIAVRDNGPGIPADILPRLPEPMLSTKPSGTGLGLVTVKRIVEENSGSLRITSQSGDGACMTICLPRQNP